MDDRRRLEDEMERLLDEGEDDPEVRAWLVEESLKEEAQALEMVRALVAEIHDRLEHQGGLVPHCAAREALEAAVVALGEHIPGIARRRNETYEQTMERVREDHARQLRYAQEVAARVFRRVLEECARYGTENEDRPLPPLRLPDPRTLD